MKKYLLLAISLLMLGCVQEDPTNPIAGKLKTLELVQSDPTDNILLEYHYDSNGRLVSLEGDSLKFFIGEKNGDVTLITVVAIDSDPVFSVTQKYKVYTDANNNIRKISFLDTLTLDEDLVSEVYYDPVDGADSVYITGNPYFYKDISGYNFDYDGNNYVSQDVSWFVQVTIGFYVYESDKVTYNHNSLLYEHPLPLQIPYLELGYAAGGYLDDNLLFHIMEMNGCSAFKKNKYLVSSISSANKGYLTNFSYLMNSSGQVSEMRISEPDGAGTNKLFKMTYY